MSTSYTKTNPFLSRIKERFSLCKPGSKKNTQHLVLDLADSGITYQVGDSIGVIPVNDQDMVQRTLHAFKVDGNEIVLERNGETPWILKDYLTKKANLADLSRKLINELHQRQTSDLKKREFDELLKDGNKQLLANYVETHQVWDALLENAEVQFAPQEIVNLLMPLLPRFYSIASSMAEVGEEVHLTVVALEYVSNDHVRHGVCTRYLLNHVPLNEPLIPIYIQPHHGFTLPEQDDVPIIMIGPGTGVAPFRAFMQERMRRNSTGKNWLFFGEQHRAQHYFYEEYWKELQEQGKLIVDTAFSRDQEHKVYVQHRMQDHAYDFFRWLEEGAYLYVCGDAHRMAKDVEAALHQIVKEQGKLDEEGVKRYIKKLRSEKRYLRDVY